MRMLVVVAMSAAAALMLFFIVDVGQLDFGWYWLPRDGWHDSDVDAR